MWFIIPSLSSTLFPLTIKWLILLPLILVEAKLWKNLVFLSPSFGHRHLDFCFYLISSSRTLLSKRSISSSLLAKSSSDSLWDSYFLSIDCSYSRILALRGPTGLKLLLIHSLMLFFNIFSFKESLNPTQPLTLKLFHHSLIEALERLSSSHISSKRKGEGPHFMLLESRKMGQWSEVGLGRPLVDFKIQIYPVTGDEEFVKVRHCRRIMMVGPREVSPS